MHDELVKRLRELQAITEHCGEQSCDECENRELCDKHDNKTLSGTYKEASDAIEKLSMRIHGDEAAIAGMKREIERMVVADKPRWIPVTERSPERFDAVIICGRMKYSFEKDYCRFVDVACFDEPEKEKDIDKWSTFNDWYEGQQEYEITHWMPLPEPPEDGEI